MQATLSNMASAAAIRVLRADDGSVYYYNTATEETSWDKPAELAVFEDSLTAMAAAAEAQPEVCAVLSNEMWCPCAGIRQRFVLLVVRVPRLRRTM